MENSEFTEELKNMDQRLIEMEDKIDLINTKLTQVVDAILGNPLTKTGGFLHDLELLNEKVAKLEKEQEKNKEFKNRVLWTVGIVIAIGMIGQYIVNIYSNIKK